MNLTVCNERIGGLKIDEALVLGPLTYFNNKEGMDVSPPIYSFMFGTSRVLSQLKGKNFDRQSLIDFNDTFLNSLENIDSELLLYLKNRLKLMSVKNKFPNLSLNSLPGCKKAYIRILKIDIENLIGKERYEFLLDIDKLRGEKHHSNARHVPRYIIQGNNINNISELTSLVKKVVKIIAKLDRKLDEIIKIYEVKITRKEKCLEVTWESLKHAFDLVNNKIVEKKKTKGLDYHNISYFSTIITLK